MIRAYVAAAALLAGLSFWAGWEWRDRSADLAESRQEVKRLAWQVEAVQDARQAEQAQAGKLAEIGETHEQDREAAPAVADAVVADLRDDRLRLRKQWAACETRALSEAAAAAVERDALAELRAKDQGNLVRVGAEADSQLAACQAVIREYLN